MNSFLLLLIIFLISVILPNANAFSPTFSTAKSGLKGGSKKVQNAFSKEKEQEYLEYLAYEEAQRIKKYKTFQNTDSDQSFVVIYLTTCFSTIVITLFIAATMF